MNKITKLDALTPIEEYNGILFKRDDLYLPYSGIVEKLGGGKVRQMQKLMISMNRIKDVKGLITTSSVHSPQSVIVAQVCKDQNIPCIICVGGNRNKLDSSIQKHQSLNVASQLGADIRIVSRLGYDSALMPHAKSIAEETGFDMVKFGINLAQFPEAIIDAIANQVENLPDELDNLIVPVGSGVTFGGILVGLHRFQKNVQNIIGVQISGYNRMETIDDILKMFDIQLQYSFFIDYQYDYTSKVNVRIVDGFDLSVIYEAKAFQYMNQFKKSLSIMDHQKSLFWVIAENNFLYTK